jgi:hypothetical protein
MREAVAAGNRIANLREVAAQPRRSGVRFAFPSAANVDARLGFDGQTMA